MTSKPAIRVDGISKLYQVGARQAGYRTLRESIAEACWAPVGRLRGLGARGWGLMAGAGGKGTTNCTNDTNKAEAGGCGDQERLRGTDFWALKDVSFEVQPGEVVGIIGRNGAGKSTLLKILSRITEPTSGRIELRGRVGSLLEVGTGFHPELTGRENIYMNGSILGMSRREITRKFDEIVAFSEIEDFLDTPVKRYSSGMYVRLAFAVAAHLEPEILIVDEVLAVGDAAFQKKCIGKMQDVAKHGRTVLFVSHNLGTIRTFCETACWLKSGRLAFRGDVNRAVREYLGTGSSSDAICTATFERPLTGHIWMTSARLICGGGSESVVETGDSLTLEVCFASGDVVQQPKCGYVICSQEGTPILNANNRYQTSAEPSPRLNSGVIICDLGTVPLLAGRYSVSLWAGDERGDTHHKEAALMFDVVDRDIWGTGRLPPRHGFCWWPTRFEVHSQSPTPTLNLKAT